MATINDPGTPTNALAVNSSGVARVGLYSPTGISGLALENDDVNTTSGIMVMGRNDRSVLPLRVDRLGSQAIALHTPLFYDSFEGVNISPNRYTITNTTMAATQSTVAGLVFNSGSVTTASIGYMQQSTKRFAKTLRAPIQFKCRARLSHYNNAVFELGFGDSNTFGGAHSNGAYWQVTAGGVLQPVLTFNSVDSTGTSVVFDITKYYTFDVFLDDDEAVFTMQDTSTGLLISKQSLKLPASTQRLWAATALPLVMRQYHTATPPSTAPQLIVTDCYVLDLDMNKNKSWPHALASMERGFTINPISGVQMTAWTNSAEPASATLSNTTAGYSGLGGKFQFAAVAGAITDYALFGLQIPNPVNFVCTGVTIDTWNTGAASATTPTLLTWALGVGSTAVSLATVTLTRVGIGSQSIPVGSAIGFACPQIVRTFSTPVHCPTGRFFHVILRMPVGTATASQVIAGMVNIEGYFE